MAKQSTQYYGTGRRKTAAARVFLRPGAGRIIVNKREIGPTPESVEFNHILEEEGPKAALEWRAAQLPRSD